MQSFNTSTIFFRIKCAKNERGRKCLKINFREHKSIFSLSNRLPLPL